MRMRRRLNVFARGMSSGIARGRWTLLFPLTLIVLSLYLAATHVLRGQSRSTTDRPAPAPMPVVAAKARSGTMGVYLTGLGTVTALNTVTVRSRVDGELVDVAFHEGQLVHKGDVLATIDPRPFQVQLTEAQGQAAKDEASLRNARIDLQRYQVLMAQDAIPRQQLDTQVATVDQFAGALKTDKGQIDSATLNLTYSRITAPIAGRIGLRLVDAGNIVHAIDQNGLAVIAQVRPIALVFTIPQDDLPTVLRRLHAGNSLDVDAYDRDLQTKLATGTLLTVDNQIDPTTGTVKLKATFPNDDDALFPNQFVNARLLVDTIHDAVLVPTAAIQRNQDTTFVYVVKPDGRVDVRNVRVRLTEGDDSAIQSGLSAGEVVVTEGVDKLQPGSLVSAHVGPADADR
jgi:membrane fusion protein, multidrug efflux system